MKTYKHTTKHQTWRYTNIQPNNKTYKHIERYQTSTGLEITCASSLSSEFFIDDRLRKCLFSCFARVHHPQRKEHNSQSRKSMVQKTHLTYPLNILGLPMVTKKYTKNKNPTKIANTFWTGMYGTPSTGKIIQRFPLYIAAAWLNADPWPVLHRFLIGLAYQGYQDWNS